MSKIEITRDGNNWVIKIRKGCSCSVRTIVLSQAEFEELKRKITEGK